MANDLLHLSGLKLDKALDTLDQESITLHLVETTPPGEKEGIGDKRVLVIRQNRPEVFTVIWSHEKYR